MHNSLTHSNSHKNYKQNFSCLILFKYEGATQGLGRSTSYLGLQIVNVGYYLIRFSQGLLVVRISFVSPLIQLDLVTTLGCCKSTYTFSILTFLCFHLYAQHTHHVASKHLTHKYHQHLDSLKKGSRIFIFVRINYIYFFDNLFP